MAANVRHVQTPPHPRINGNVSHDINFVDATEAAFVSEDIPWAAIASQPNEYYDTAKFEVSFASNGVSELTLAEWHELAKKLAAGAGAGTSGFFRKVPPPMPAPPRSPSPHRSTSPPPAEGREAERLKEREAEERDREAAHLRCEAEEAARLRREAEVREAEEREREVARRGHKAEEAARLRREAEEREAEEREAEEHEREAERLRCEAEELEEEGRHAEEEEVPPVPKKTGRKRKAVIQLVPEDAGVAGVAGRPSRTRKTPKEAELERAAKIKATVHGAGKPGYEYVERSPVKGARGGARRSTTRGANRLLAPFLSSYHITLAPHSRLPPPFVPHFTPISATEMECVVANDCVPRLSRNYGARFSLCHNSLCRARPAYLKFSFRARPLIIARHAGGALLARYALHLSSDDQCAYLSLWRGIALAHLARDPNALTHSMRRHSSNCLARTLAQRRAHANLARESARVSARCAQLVRLGVRVSG
ncbi:hypothetical protein B0H11DRAFT_2257889 [Mycena galericulata]|nr:hypothetical protein B0H11DRAFT_2257889 [Mycena galericulata]